MKELKEITDAWGKWKAKRLGTSLRFTESTKYGNRSELDQYHQYQVNVSQNNSVYYAPSSPQDGGYLLAGNYDYTNNTSVAQTYTFKTTYQNADEFAWSVTENVKVGEEITVQAKIPFIIDATSKTTFEFSIASTQGKKTTNTQTYDLSIPILVPPYTRAYGNSQLIIQKYNTAWWADVMMKGYVAVWFNDKVDYGNPGGGNTHWLWFIPIETVLRETANNNLINTDGYTAVSGGVKTTAKGQYTSSLGAIIKVVSNEESLVQSRSLTTREPEVVTREYYPLEKAIPAYVEPI